MVKDKYDIFISYSRLDISLAKKIQQALQCYGFKCFRDTSDIHASQDWIDIITERIMDCKLFLLLGSSNAYRSKWTKREISFADNHNIQIVPYLIDNSELPHNLSFILSNITTRSMSDFPIGELAKELRVLIASNPAITPQPIAVPKVVIPEFTFTKGRPIEFMVNDVKFGLMPVKAGKFLMGTVNRGNGHPAHEVQLLKDYYIGETVVTQALWEAVMHSNPSHFRGATHPVETVSWDECQEFLKRLREITRHNFRLPTEAEWEFAARGCSYNPDNLYAGSSEVWNVAWYKDNNSNSTSPVKQKLKNELGIYDMSGNVNEWCQDYYDTYPRLKLIDPIGPKVGSMRVVRGGSWYENEIKCRVYIRNRALPSTRSINLGLRLALSYGS